MNDSSEDENQPCSSKKTQNYRKTKNVPSVRWSPLLEDNAFHNPNDELLLFSEITGRVRNTPQDQETHIPCYFLLINHRRHSTRTKQISKSSTITIAF